jgi:ATP-dependent Clp protease adaptor protein ClpS
LLETQGTATLKGVLPSQVIDMASDPREKEDNEGDLATEKKRKVEKVRRYKVLFHNDDYTTMEFVVLVLMKFFHKSETEATHIMLSVHHKGYGVAGLYTKDVAETKVAEVHDFAKEYGMPLRLTAEPE